MFCPGCGLENNRSNQYCRVCGTDLRPVRLALESPDDITASAVSARDEIGRAVAAKIRETQTVYELKKVAEDVLPEIEKFLESPAEKRLRRMRTGTTIASIGIGAAVALSLVSIFTRADETIFLAGLGLITFFIGLGFILNGIFLTIPKKALADKSNDAESQRERDESKNFPALPTNDLYLTDPVTPFASVTEQTTRHLKKQ